MLLKGTPQVEQAEDPNTELWIEFIVVPFSEISLCRNVSVPSPITYILQ